MHLGTPVVPEENRMYSGWSKGSASKAISPAAYGAMKSSKRCAAGTRETSGRYLRSLPQGVEGLSVVEVPVGREQDLRTDLAEAIENAADAEVRRARREGRAHARSREHGGDRL